MYLAAIWMLACSALGQEAGADSSRAKGAIVGLSLQALRHSQRDSQGHALLGNAGVVGFGGGYIGASWLTLTYFDQTLGPYEPTGETDLDVDFNGTGVSTFWGYSAQKTDLRSDQGGYGFGLSLSYADLVGRLPGSSRTSAAANGSEVFTENYVMRVTNLSVAPTIFFSWLAKARDHSNKPENLATRIEGFMLTIGAQIPIESRFSTRYQFRVVERGQIARGQDGLRESTANVRERGKLRGYTIVVGLTTMMGT
jgi:hypothetical protein